MSTEDRPATGPGRIGDSDGTDDVVARVADAAWSIATSRDGRDLRMILRGPVDVHTTRTVMARLDEVLESGDRVVTIDVTGLSATHDQVAGLLGEAQCHAGDHRGLVVAVGVRPDAVPGNRPVEG